MWYQCNKEGKTSCCAFCGNLLRSSPVCDPFPYCKRKRCIKKRESKEREEIENLGGPAEKIS